MISCFVDHIVVVEPQDQVQVFQDCHGITSSFVLAMFTLIVDANKDIVMFVVLVNAGNLLARTKM